MRDLFNGFSSHNWKFIEHWTFPGVFPPMADLKKSIPEKRPESQQLFGQRVVALEHLNILLRIFTHLDELLPEDIEGFSHWACNWYEDSKDGLETILESGDTYPLDFIVWLRDVIFRQEDSVKIFGRELKARLQMFEAQNNRPRKAE